MNLIFLESHDSAYNSYSYDIR